MICKTHGVFLDNKECPICKISSNRAIKPERHAEEDSRAAPGSQNADLINLEKYIEEAKNLARLRRSEAIEFDNERSESFYNGQLAVLEGIWVRFDQLFGEGLRSANILNLLRVAVCPECDGSGAKQVQTSLRQYVTREMAIDAGDRSMEGSLYSDDEFETQQCQWCYERAVILSENVFVAVALEAPSVLGDLERSDAARASFPNSSVASSLKPKTLEETKDLENNEP